MTVGASNVNSRHGVSSWPGPLGPRQVLRPERVGQQLAQRPRAQRMVDQQLRAAVLEQHLPAPPARHQQLARAVHTRQRDQPCRRPWNAGRRPQRTRHRDQGHMRHSPHCTRPPFGDRPPAPPPRPGIPSTAHRRWLPPQLPCAATFSNRYLMSCHLTWTNSECIPKPRSPVPTSKIGNPNFGVFRAPTAKR